MQPQDLIERQLVLSGLQHGASPTLKAVARRLLAFDLEAGAAVREQKKTRRARDHIGASVADDLIRLRPERARAEIRQCFRFTNDWAEVPVAEQIVADLVAAGRNRRAP